MVTKEKRKKSKEVPGKLTKFKGPRARNTQMLLVGALWIAKISAHVCIASTILHEKAKKEIHD